MYYRPKIVKFRIILALATLTAALLSGICAYAQESPVYGLYNSPKGFGFSIHAPEKSGTFDTFCLHADSFGFFSGRASNPGIKFNYSHNFILKEFRDRDMHVELFAGPGVSASYVYDYETSRVFVLFGGDKLTKNMGFAPCLSATGGARLMFDHSRFSFDISLRSEIGVHIRRNEEGTATSMSWYIMGVLETFYPELTILYSF